MSLFVDEVRSQAKRIVDWCDDEDASLTVLGSIVGELESLIDDVA